MVAHLTHLTLNRFTPQQVERMAMHVAGGKILPAAILGQLVARTDGVPLYVEEMTKTVLESGLLEERDDRYEPTGPLPALAIPATLHDALMARLDRLAAVKTVVQLGASIGRQFSYGLLEAVSSLDEAQLQHRLGQLVEAEILVQRGLPPEATYTFKHVLIQEAAYQSLLKSTRQQYHQRIATVLESQFPEIAEHQPELLAYHCTESGLNEKAVGYWQQAGEKAMQRSANEEATRHFETGLALLKPLPDTSERARQELLLLTQLGPALITTKGYAVPEVGQAYARAHALCASVKDTALLFPVLNGLWRFYRVRGDIQKTRGLAEESLRLARRLQSQNLEVEAHAALGVTMLSQGALADAKVHLERSIALSKPEDHATHVVLYTRPPGINSGAYLGCTLWYLGYPDQAWNRKNHTLTLAQDLSHPFSRCIALYGAAMLAQLRRQGTSVRELTEAMIGLATEHGFTFWVDWATVLQGWSRTERGQIEEGIIQMRQGIDSCQAKGAKNNHPYFWGMLAEAYGKVRWTREGLHVLVEALTEVEKTGNRLYEAELHRLKGELLLAQSSDNQAEAETSFQQALGVARSQQAKSLELRAVMSLARLWQSRDKRQDAYDLLAPVYNWFTEGFDTADLKEAKALLQQLGG